MGNFIWHNRDNNTIEFWGPRESIKRANSVINARIKKYEGITTIDSSDYVEDSGGGMVHRSWATEEECKAHDVKTQNVEIVPVNNEGDKDASKLSGSETGGQ